MFDIIGKNIRDARLSRGWSQRFVAGQLNISHQTISRLENGCPVSSHMLKKIAGLLQIPLSDVYKEQPLKNESVVSIPDEVMSKMILNCQPLVECIYHESVLRYKAQLKQQAVLLQEDIESLIAQYLNHKASYSLSDLIYVGMLANQKTLEKVMITYIG